MNQCQETVEEVLGEFGFADGPDLLVLLFQVDFAQVFFL